MEVQINELQELKRMVKEAFYSEIQEGVFEKNEITSDMLRSYFIEMLNCNDISYINIKRYIADIIDFNEMVKEVS